MKTFFRAALLLPFLGLLAGCCANSTCTRNDVLEDSLYLVLPDASLSSDTAKVSFTRAELDTVYLYRYSPATPTVLADPVTIVRARTLNQNSLVAAKLASTNPALPNSTIVISNNTPFAASTTGGKLNAYNYLLKIQDLSKGSSRTTYTFYLTDIQLKGQYNADGCCTYYTNTLKTLLLKRNLTDTGVLQTLTETGGVPVPILLKKP